MTRKLIVLLACVGLVGAACKSTPSATQTSPTTLPTSPILTPTSPSPPAAVALSLPRPAFQFGTYVLVPLLPDTPAYAGPKTPNSLSGVRIDDSISSIVNDPQVKAKLTKNGFVVVPSDYLRFDQVYSNAPYNGSPVFVTTDAGYHEWHLVFDKVLRDLEQQVLLPKLEQLVTQLLDRADHQVKVVKGTPLEADADRVRQLMQVAASLLDPNATTGPLARQELSLIRSHAGQQKSPITGIEIDYSLYTPRGHYTKTEELTRYFLGMSVLGQTAFLAGGVEPMRLGILASRLFAQPRSSSGELEALWKDIYEPTAFLVGSADDYTPYEVNQAVAAAMPSGMTDPAVFADDAAVAGVASQLVATREVQIDPENASVRIMGVRFVIDSYVLDQLIYPNVGTPTDMRLVPSPLDLAAAFGSGYAYKLQKQAGQTRYANYDSQINEMQDAVQARPEQDWGATVYDAWLKAIEPMWLAHGKAFPDFMRTTAWKAKDHQTGFGSYAELKHDTLLYVKQLSAEGAGAPPPHGNWVEPDPVAFERIAAAAALMRDGLSQRKLLTDEQETLIRDLEELLAFFGRVARTELAGQPISAVDDDRLLDIGAELEGMFWRTGDVVPTGDTGTYSDQDEAIVADIGRSADQVLEVATGRVDQIFVLVPDENGVFQVTVGGVYSYYEFLQPVSDRLTDEAWRDMLNSGQAPDRPAWEEAILAR
jgi:hypothetical protein